MWQKMGTESRSAKIPNLPYVQRDSLGIAERAIELMRARTSQFKALVIATISILTLTWCATPLSAAENPPRKIVSGWIPYYGIKNGLASAIANQDLIKEVSPFWYSVKSSTSITDQYATAKLTDPMSVPIGALRSLGFTIVPTITDGTDKLVLSGILGDDAQRTSLISTITSLVRANNFDGIDLDFENFAFTDGKASWPTTQPRWIQFIKELSTSLHAEQKLLFVTAPVDFDPKVRAGGYSVYAWRDIATAIDRLRIMTYDYSTSAIGPIGPLPWVEDSIKYATSVMPASKVFIGVPGYGRDWVDSVSGTCPVEVQGTITTKAKAATFVMRDALNLATSYGATPTYQEKEGEVTFTYSKTFSGQSASGLPTTCTAKRVAWFQNDRSYVERAKLVAKYRLGGIILWTMGMEDAVTMPAVRSFAQTIAPDVVLSSLALDKKNAQYGDLITVSTLFSLPDKQPIANLPIRIESKNSDGSWRRIYEGITDSTGKVAVTALFGNSTTLRATSESSWERLASQSQENSAVISPLVEINAPLIVAKSSEYLIRGSLQPRVENVALSLEKLVRGNWQKISFKSAPKTDATGHYSFTVSESSDGFSTYRVRSSATTTLESGLSPTITVVIR